MEAKKEQNYFGINDKTPEYVKGLLTPKARLQVNIENAKEVFQKSMSYYLEMQNKDFVWRNEYTGVVEWLIDNQGKGLLLSGSCGTGKSIIARYTIPLIFSRFLNKKFKVFEYYELNPNADEIVGRRDESPGIQFFILDDIGAESRYNQFGNERLVFADIMDVVEKDGRFPIITTNLTPDELKAKYGIRTIDRIISSCKWVKFEGKSLR